MESCDKSISAEAQNNDVTLNNPVEATTSAAEPIENVNAEPKTDYSVKSKAELLDELATLVEKPVDEVRDEVAAIKHAFYVIRKQELEKEKQEFLDRGNEEAAFAPMPDEAEARLKELLNTYKERRAEQLAAIEAEQQANLDKKKQILSELAEIAGDADNINKHYQRFQQLQQDFKTAGSVPPSEDKGLWKEYQTVTEQFYDLWKINKELRDYDFKKNLEAKEALCEEAERLGSENDVIAIQEIAGTA